MNNNSKAGRPSKFTQEIADEICDITSTSNRSLASICKEFKITPSTVYNWLQSNPQFLKKYARAKDWQADFLAEEILEIADDRSEDIRVVQFGNEEKEIENKEFISRSRLRVDSRKWLASKLKPKKYGDKQEVDFGDNVIKITIGKPK